MSQLNKAAWPAEIARFLGNASLTDISGMSGATTYFVDRDGGCYLKVWEKGLLRPDYDTLRFFAQYVPVPKVVFYQTLDRDYLLTRPLDGKRACDPVRICDPECLAVSLGAILRRFHDSHIPTCPFTNNTADMLSRVERNYHKRQWDEGLASYIGETDIDRMYGFIQENLSLLRDDTIIHGDYCLPNIFLDDSYQLTGFLDLGMAGSGDSHYDLFWGRWSLQFNLGTDAYGDLFFQSYGLDAIDPQRLKVIGCLSCMGE